MLYKLFGEINTIQLVIENKFRKPKIEDLKNNIKSILNAIQFFSFTAIKSNLEKAINSSTANQMMKHLNESKNLFLKIINEATLHFLEKHPDYILVN